MLIANGTTSRSSITFKMARLFTSGFELNSLTAGMEWDAAVGVTISSTTVRSGGFAGRVSSLISGTNQRFRCQFKAAGNNGPFYFRFYFRAATFPSAENRIFALSSSATTGTGVAALITVDNSGALRLYDNIGSIGSASSALSTGTWYRIEVLFDRTASAGSQVLRALIDGVQFAGATNRTLGNSILDAYYGGNLNSEAQTTGDWFFDDIAINDSAGSNQNGFPGSGKVIHLKPNAAGDANSFAVQVGGTAGSANNYTRVNEVPPDDATSYNGSAVLAQEDLFNVTDSGIGAQDIVNMVAVGVRFADLVGADATAAFKVEIIKTSGGTKIQSSALVPNSTTWKSNAAATPLIFPIITYADPDGDSWEKTTLDSMQIGYALTAINVQTIAISNVYAIIDYTPYTPTVNKSNFLALM